MTMADDEELAESLAEVINQSQAILGGSWGDVSLDEYRNRIRRVVTGLADPTVFGSHIDLDEVKRALGEAGAILENASAWHGAMTELKPKLERFLVSVRANDL